MSLFLVSPYGPTKSAAVATLAITDEFAALLTASFGDMPGSVSLVVNDDCRAFETSPQFDLWVASGYVRKLKASGLANDAKGALLRAAAIDLLAAQSPYFDFREVAVLARFQPAPTPEFPFKKFGEGWPSTWKATAEQFVHLFGWAAQNPAFEFLAAREKVLLKASLGTTFLAWTHSLRERIEKEEAQRAAAEARRVIAAAKPQADLDFIARVGQIARSLPAGALVRVRDKNGKELFVSRYAAPTAIAQGIYTLA